MFTWIGSVMARFTPILDTLAHVGLSEAWPIVLIAVAYLLGVQGITAAIHIPLKQPFSKN